MKANVDAGMSYGAGEGRAPTTGLTGAADANDVILLLGHRTTPTDGVDDYCTALKGALQRRGHRVAKVRVLWKEVGWAPALLSLWRTSGQWRGRWVLVQYTALTWDRKSVV